MDVLCDTLLLEEILPRLPPKYLLRLGATARRYDALTRNSDHAARFWCRAGVIFQPFDQPIEAVPRFLTGPRAATSGGHGHALAEVLHGQRGTSYWTPYGNGGSLLIAYDSDAARHSIRVIRLPDPLFFDNERNRCIGERHGGGLRYVQSSRSELQVWDSQSGGMSWTLVHRVGAVELVERTPGTNPRYWDHQHLKPIGIHPTDDDVIFVALPGAVVAYSMAQGTISLGCPHDDCGFVSATEAFPYAHPPFPIQIPAIKSSALALPDNGGPPAASSLGNDQDIWWNKKRKRKMCTELSILV